VKRPALKEELLLRRDPQFVDGRHSCLCVQLVDCPKGSQLVILAALALLSGHNVTRVDTSAHKHPNHSTE
jgi:hypothetical protein